MDALPRRLKEDRSIRNMLRSMFDKMQPIVEHRSHIRQAPLEAGAARRVKECVAIVTWEEPDGSETISVVGGAGVAPLEVKGLLHQAVYAIAHADSPEYQPAH